uniref:Uncharacterized protein n=1 Tax=viral metagenome TaxID=1070528 RepID=A0A6C0KLQ5_9ZZZZ
MKGKYTRLEMFGAITSFCIKNDLHITYLERTKKAELEAIIIKYDINVEELLFEKAEAHKNAVNGFQNITNKAFEDFTDKIQILVDRTKMLVSLLNDEQKEKYKEYCESQILK